MFRIFDILKGSICPTISFRKFNASKYYANINYFNYNLFTKVLFNIIYNPNSLEGGWYLDPSFAFHIPLSIFAVHQCKLDIYDTASWRHVSACGKIGLNPMEMMSDDNPLSYLMSTWYHFAPRTGDSQLCNRPGFM